MDLINPCIHEMRLVKPLECVYRHLLKLGKLH